MRWRLALIYLSPALMDWLVFFVSFAVFYAAGVRGVGMAECGWLGVLFQAAYMTSSFVSGHFITCRNAQRVLLLSTLAPGLVVFGGSAAWFFNSFQAFMRGAASAKHWSDSDPSPGSCSATPGCGTAGRRPKCIWLAAPVLRRPSSPK